MKFSLSRFESRTIIIAVIGMLGFGYWLTRDDLFSAQTNQGIEIGKFKAVVKNVKSRTSNSFVWDSAYEDLPIYQRQNIFTGPDSEAEIELESGSKLFVKPNSLIRLVTKNGGIQLDLKYGQLESQLSKTEKLIISDGETKTEVRAENKESRVALTRKKQESAKIRSLAGSVQVKSGKTEIKLSKPNDEARIKVGRVESPTATTKLTAITADNQSFLRYRPEDPIYLQWLTTNPSVHNRMTVAEDAALTIVKKAEIVKGDRYTITKEFADRKYFWKLEAVDDNQKVISQLPIQSFSIKTVAIPEISSPENKATLKYGSDTSVSPVPLELKGNSFITTFHIEIASDEKFQNVVFKEKTQKASITSTGLTTGKYYARVSGEG
ncbi:MAG TPA: FecR domain-containing protein, partial [Pseudobdellovibrionaceae bacterium]|nr:FecR domain-containing protein [Pseudobdellovibrionaceae bacterium]